MVIERLMLPMLSIALMIGCSTEQRYNKKVRERGPIPQPKYEIDLSQLDSVGCIYFWEVQDGALQIYTVEDEIQNELDRLEDLKDNFYE